jgi:hypothetical protein
MGNRFRSFALAAVSCVALPAVAGEFDYDFGLAYGHSDNIRRTPEDEVSESIAAATAKFSFDQRSSRLTADLVGDLAWNEYLDDTFDSELTGNFAGTALFELLPERIQWFAGDTFGQVLSDPFIPATPENSENINQFVTGPNFIVGLGSQMRMQLSARYINTTYERLPLDSTAYRGELAVIRVLSGRSSVSANVRGENVEFKEELLGADYKSTEAFVRYDASGARTNLSVDLGYSQIDRDAADEKEDGAVVRVEVSRQLSAASLAFLSAGREFSNASTAFAGGLAVSGVNLSTTPGQQTAQPFTNDYANLRWQFTRNRTGLTVLANWSKRSYDDQPLFDQTLTSYGATLRRDMSPSTSLMFDATMSSGKFAQAGNEYDELSAGLTFNWVMSRRLTMNVAYDYFDRDSDAAIGSYKESRVWVGLSFGSGRPRSMFVDPTFGADAAN